MVVPAKNATICMHRGKKWNTERGEVDFLDGMQEIHPSPDFHTRFPHPVKMERGVCVCVCVLSVENATIGTLSRSARASGK